MRSKRAQREQQPRAAPVRGQRSKKDEKKDDACKGDGEDEGAEALVQEVAAEQEAPAEAEQEVPAEEEKKQQRLPKKKQQRKKAAFQT